MTRTASILLLLAFFGSIRPGLAQPPDCKSPGFSGFAAVTISGIPFVWAYRASDGVVCLDAIDNFLNRFNPAYETKWDTGFTSFASFTLSGVPYLWCYRASDGTVVIHQIKGASGFTQTYYYKWDKGFSGFVALTVNGNPYMWAYRASDGRVCIHKLFANGAGFTQASMTQWDAGFTSFVQAGDRYVWAYRSSDGVTTIHEVKGDGSGFAQKYFYKWDTGFSNFAYLSLMDGPYVWAYRASDGTVCIHRIASAGTSFTQTHYQKWDNSYLGLAGFSQGGVGYVLAYRSRDSNDAAICIHRINQSGKGFTQILYQPFFCHWQRRSGWVTDGSGSFRVELILDMDGSSLRISSRSQGKFLVAWYDRGSAARYSGSFSGPSSPWQPFLPNPFTVGDPFFHSAVPASFVQFNDITRCFVMDHGSYLMEALSPDHSVVSAKIAW